ncbi:MAG: HAD-IA family hydrolase [Actinobacteria bacterium]|nr:HAD-IA family hydrolase [Actinomycetota bacterium]
MTSDRRAFGSKERALIFDFDGLLVDTETPAWRTWQEIYKEHGQELSIALWAKGVGTLEGFDPARHLQELVGRVLEVEALGTDWSERRLVLTDLEGLRPGVERILKEARAAGLGLAIASSASGEWITSILERIGANDWWDAVYCADGVAARAKPEPCLYLAAVEGFGLQPDRALAFEDSPNGIKAAKRAGLYCVAVPNSVTAGMDLSEADQVLDSLEDVVLPDLLATALPGQPSKP